VGFSVFIIAVSVGYRCHDYRLKRLGTGGNWKPKNGCGRLRAEAIIDYWPTVI
jgi:hypothetical protein